MSNTLRKQLANVELICPFCNADHYVQVYTNDWANYIHGAYVHEAFPYLNATQREQLISRLCPKCQEGIFG